MFWLTKRTFWRTRSREVTLLFTARTKCRNASWGASSSRLASPINRTQHVSRANEELAIDSLLVTDGLFRSRCAPWKFKKGWFDVERLSLPVFSASSRHPPARWDNRRLLFL